jgi:hypothetical protein
MHARGCLCVTMHGIDSQALAAHMVDDVGDASVGATGVFAKVRTPVGRDYGSIDISKYFESVRALDLIHLTNNSQKHCTYSLFSHPMFSLVSSDHPTNPGASAGRGCRAQGRERLASREFRRHQGRVAPRRDRRTGATRARCQIVKNTNILYMFP